MKRSPLTILFVTVFIDLLGFGFIFPILPLYVKQFGGAPVVSGWLAASYNVMQFAFAPLWGRLSDRWDRRDRDWDHDRRYHRIRRHHDDDDDD